MLAKDLNEKELRREIYALRRELRDDIREVRTLAKDDFLIPKTAIRQLEKVNKTMRTKAVSKMDKEELQGVYRKLSHIRELKSSTKLGAQQITQHLERIIPSIRKLTPTQTEKMWVAYDKLVSLTGLEHHLKYEVYGAIADTLTQSRISPEELAIKVEQLYNLARRGKLKPDEYKDKTTKLLLQSFKTIL